MTLFQNTFEGGTPGTPATVANSGGLSGDAFSTKGGSTDRYVADGYKSAVGWSPSSAGGILTWNHGGTTTAYRFYFKLSANATTSAYILSAYAGGSTANGTHRLVANTTGRIAIQNATGGTIFTTASPLTIGTWYRLEGMATPGTSTTTGAIDFAYYEGDSTTPVETYSRTNVNMGTLAPSSTAFGRMSGAWNNGVPVFDNLAVNDAATGFIGPVASQAAGFKLWNGNTEQPLTMNGVWTGTALVPGTYSVT